MAKLKAKPPEKIQPRRAKILVMGGPGVGKTWGCLDFPVCYYIDVEGGATRPLYIEKLKKAGGVYLGPEDGANDFDVVIEQVQALATTHHEYRTLVIDSFSELYGLSVAAEEERLKNAKKEQAFGNQKIPATRDSRRLMNWLKRVDMNVLIVCHEKAKWEGGEQVGHTFDGWEKLEYSLDLALHVRKMGPQRLAIVGKSRLEEFPSGDRLNWSYEAFAERYGAAAMEGESKSIVLASPEQVERVESLAKALKLDPAKQSKWFTAAGVEDWREMDEDTIGKCIAALAKEIEQPQAA